MKFIILSHLFIVSSYESSVESSVMEHTLRTQIETLKSNTKISFLLSSPDTSPMDAASQKLGQKLLQGWTMLGESCPFCNSPLMRSRDGTQTICVVCVPKPAEATANPSTEIPPSQSIQEYPMKPHNLPRHFDLHSINNVILNSLDTSLNISYTTEIFSDILESALKPLKALEFSKNENENIIRSIENKISRKLESPCISTDPNAAISYFISVDRLIKLFIEFKDITEY